MAVRALRSLVAILVGPHELAHAAVARLAGMTPEITLLPEHASGIPLGQFDATIPPSTSTNVIRVCALAPLPINLAVAVGVGTALPADSPLAVALFPLIAYWATLSGGDVAVAANPVAARNAGRFRAPGRWWQTVASLLLVPPVAVAVAVSLLVDLPPPVSP
ncbi:hypothetical protein PN416_01080 [Halorubrum ezzemoulense]|uniref:hypothetical protein n=1 Tax=Halorubrum ezzemoulense TaxID=337243 RepID=UPI00232AE4CD|nr:hypothetical protein [Halorubrum ezzemoulense]MDB9278775.1 hypothetical protein [Halorubrum ezzemoulense]MDB9282025.1 hypothetical protein [Halorubrum ezzemoulense]